MQVYKDNEIDLAVLASKTVAIIGYGNQGRPQALNLRDSGIKTLAGIRAGSKKAELIASDNLISLPISDAVQQSDVVMLQLPDETMASVYETNIAPFLKPGQYIGFSHGMAIHAKWVQPKAEINVFLLAPKAQGRGVRNQYLAGSGVPGLVSVHQDFSGDTLAVALAYGKAIGCGRAGILPTTFQQETEADLFSEQAVLCGGLSRLITRAFETLVDAGFDPAIAYFECLYEVKLIADLLQEGGINYARQKISSTALFGDLSQGDKIIDDHVVDNMKSVLSNIQSGNFSRQFLIALAEDSSALKKQTHLFDTHAIEQTGRELRAAGVLKQPG